MGSTSCIALVNFSCRTKYQKTMTCLMLYASLERQRTEEQELKRGTRAEERENWRQLVDKIVTEKWGQEQKRGTRAEESELEVVGRQDTDREERNKKRQKKEDY